jgi:hypothetical protein
MTAAGPKGGGMQWSPAFTAALGRSARLKARTTAQRTTAKEAVMNATTSSNDTQAASPRSRRRWAAALERTARDAHRAWQPRGMRPLAPARTVLACEPSLLAVAAALRDEDAHVSTTALDAVVAFLTDGVGSPLYRYDLDAAAFAAERLEAKVTPARPAPALAA